MMDGGAMRVFHKNSEESMAIPQYMSTVEALDKIYYFPHAVLILPLKVSHGCGYKMIRSSTVVYPLYY